MKCDEDFEQFVDATENTLYGVVDSGEEDELFVASYLHGHFSLVVSQLMQNQQCSLAQLDQAMQKSFDNAFDNQELEPKDQKLVRSLWQRLYLQSQENAHC